MRIKSDHKKIINYFNFEILHSMTIFLETKALQKDMKMFIML